jgi:predicted nucleotidyltransferase
MLCSLTEAGNHLRRRSSNNHGARSRLTGSKLQGQQGDQSHAAWQGVGRGCNRRVHWFGSILDAPFRDHSDLDLLVEGLSPDGLLEANALAEAAGPMAVGLKRQEDLSDDLVDRLMCRSQIL